MINRERNLEHLSNEQVNNLQNKLSAKLLEILEKASKEANELTNQYGIEVKIGYVMEEKNTDIKSS